MMNYDTRNHLINASHKVLSEKERLELGMKPAEYDDEGDLRFEKMQSIEQVKKSSAILNSYMFNIGDSFFTDESNENVEVTIDGCRKFFERTSDVTAVPRRRTGRRCICGAGKEKRRRMMKLTDWFRAWKKKREAKKQAKLERQLGTQAAETLQLEIDPSQTDPPQTRYTEEYQAFLKEQEKT